MIYSTGIYPDGKKFLVFSPKKFLKKSLKKFWQLEKLIVILRSQKLIDKSKCSIN